MTSIFRSGIPLFALLLGLGGLIPFVALAIASIVDPIRTAVWVASVMSYAAIILSFVGALHWAFAMTASELTDRRRRATYTWSVVPALIGWSAILVLPFWATASAIILLTGFWMHYLQDRRLARLIDIPGWYLPLRLVLTSVATISILVAALASFR